MEDLFMGIDIGTGSVRVGLFTKAGRLICVHVSPITVCQSDGNSDVYEQSTEEIWSCAIKSMKMAFEKASAYSSAFALSGVCIDATCSLSFADINGSPLPLLTSNGKDINNTIMWLDHRAADETNVINSTSHVALSCYGGKLSLEMEPPKLLWTKKHLNCVWDKAAIVLDLADFITYKLTRRNNVRSICTMACKWAYDSLSCNYREDFWNLIDMQDVFDRFLAKNTVIPPGINIEGQASAVLKEIGLPLSGNFGVSAGVVDAYAGALGCLANKVSLQGKIFKPSEIGAMICGTSTCLFVFVENSSSPPPTVSGVWGPFWNVLGNNLWVYEAGQSAAGKLLDWLFDFHPAGKQFSVDNRSSALLQHLERLRAKKNLSSIHFLTSNAHVCPDFHGNRSPLARADMRGVFVGLDFELSVDSLAVWYLAMIQALAYNIRYMYEVFAEFGVKLPKVMVACGGLARDNLYVQTHADVLELPFAVSHCTEVVLLGGAILASVASGAYRTVAEASESMASECDIISPETDPETVRFHEKKYKVYRKMLRDQIEILSTMTE